MPADTTYRITSVSGEFAGKIKSFVSNGFTIGANNEVNRSATTCWYVALANDANNDFAVGTYLANTGTCADNCDVTISPAFQPNLVVLQGGTHVGVFKTATHTTLSCRMGAQVCATNYVQTMNAGGFQYGGDSNVNSNGTNYYYFAIKAVSGSNGSGSYTGNTTDNQQITSLGFQPEFLFIKGDSATAAACGRLKDHSGDDSVTFTAGASAANQVQNFLSNGFEYGTAACVNEDTVTMYWYAIKAPTVVTGYPQIIIVE
jgi:ribulose bisphosphate carboxylase small subunit